MHAASLKGDKHEIVEMLIEAGARVDSFMKEEASKGIGMALKKNKKVSFLHLLHFCHSEKIKKSNDLNVEMLAARCYVSEGCTPLMLAAMEGNEKCLEILIERGANVNHKTDYGSFTALTLATMNNHQICLITLIGKGAKITEVVLQPSQKEAAALGLLCLPSEKLYPTSIAENYKYQEISVILYLAIQYNKDIVERRNEW